MDWTCAICGFEADSEVLRDEHMRSMTDKPHQELLKEKAGNVVDDIGDKAKDAWEGVKEKTGMD